MNKYFIIFFKPGEAWIEGKSVFEQPLDDHVRFLKHLYNKGIVTMAGPLHDGSSGVTILRSVSLQQATELVNKDPDVIRKVLTPEVKQWQPLDFEAVEA